MAQRVIVGGGAPPPPATRLGALKNRAFVFMKFAAYVPVVRDDQGNVDLNKTGASALRGILHNFSNKRLPAPNTVWDDRVKDASVQINDDGTIVTFVAAPWLADP